MSPNRVAGNFRTSPTARFKTGCIASLTDGEQVFAHHFTGSGREATRAVADYCDAYGLRVVCLSTPETIYRDLQGNREQEKPYHATRIAATNNRPDLLRLPEPSMLGAIKRLDLLA